MEKILTFISKFKLKTLFIYCKKIIIVILLTYTFAGQRTVANCGSDERW